ncbi:MAG: GNAT family N-acetyltransferase [Bacteroidales bacterium]|nr:GNAT family N-acetyltransferase [Bacteroidales bacterium]
MNMIQPGPVLNRYNLSGKKHLYISDHRYCVKLAETFDEIDSALRLRFEVFNLELNEGLTSSYLSLRDEDQFDRQCHHLLVIEKNTREVVGTYRMQTYEMARKGHGFYAATEFEINRLGWFRLMQSVELGRACISSEHRNGRVLFLLWKGIGQYLQIHQKRYLFGCCSFASQDVIEGTLLMNTLIKRGCVRKTPRINPRKAYKSYLNKLKHAIYEAKNTPPLMEMYFRYGAKVCSYPAIDREFKTIDYLVLLDLNELAEDKRNLLL